MPFTIAITSRDELNTFVRNTALHAKMKTSPLKSAIVKGKGFAHISQLTKTFDDNKAIENNRQAHVTKEGYVVSPLFSRAHDVAPVEAEDDQ